MENFVIRAIEPDKCKRLQIHTLASK